MELKDTKEIITAIDNLSKEYGYFWSAFYILMTIFSVLIWMYLSKKSKIIAEEASEKSLKKFQAALDQDLYRFQTQHQKQIDALHDIYQKFQALSSILNYIMNGEKFTQPISASNQLLILIDNRHDFKKIYQQNNLLFRKDLCRRIDSLIIVVDEFIEAFENGLISSSFQEFDNTNINEPQLLIVGIWRHGELQLIIEKVTSISSEIEVEFRKVYGTAFN